MFPITSFIVIFGNNIYLISDNILLTKVSQVNKYQLACL